MCTPYFCVYSFWCSAAVFSPAAVVGCISNDSAQRLQHPIFTNPSCSLAWQPSWWAEDAVSPVISNVKLLLMCSLVIFFRECLFKALASFEFCCCCYCCIWEFPVYSGYWSLLEMWFSNIFSHSLCCLFTHPYSYLIFSFDYFYPSIFIFNLTFIKNKVIFIHYILITLFPSPFP